MRERLRVFAAVFRDPNLLRIELAYAGFNMTEYATWVAILVFAYNRGGATMAGLVAMIQLIPSAIVAPLASYAGDRFRRDRVLLIDYVVQAVSILITAAGLFAHAPIPLIYGMAAVAAASLTFTRPAMGSLLPAVTETPEDLTAANVASGVIENAGIFAGPFLAGLILTSFGPGAVFAVFGGITAIGALLTWRLDADPAAVTPKERVQAEAVWRETLAGFRVLRRERDPRLLVMLTSVELVVWGALDILFVAAAIDLLGMGNSGAGYLSSAFGAGGVVGAGAAVLLVGRRGLTPPLALGSLLFGFPICAVATASVITAPVMFAVSGGGRAVGDVASHTLLQRISPDEVLSRVFGVVEGIAMLALAVGSVGASALVAAFGIKTALIVAGALMPAAVLVTWRHLLAIDAEAPAPDAAALALLRRIPIFAPLSAPAIERVMAHLVAVEAGPGDVIIRQGDAGDRFYVVAEGQAEVTIDGSPVTDRTTGDYFGEIALLRDVPRIATVTARTRMKLHALDRDPFLEAVTGHPQSVEAADAVVRERLGDGPS